MTRPGRMGWVVALPSGESLGAFLPCRTPCTQKHSGVFQYCPHPGPGLFRLPVRDSKEKPMRMGFADFPFISQ